MNKIPLYKPYLSDLERSYLLEAFDSSWISSKGEFVNRFEESFSKFVGVSNCTTVCNGTTALHLALLALGIGKGDEVIVPTLTYIASVNAIIYVGATPVFVDSEYDTWQMSVADIERKINGNTKAIMSVHLYGHPCDIGSIKNICAKNNIYLIEDCAEALGAYYHREHVGSWADVSCYSFFGNKTVTTGEGGMLVAQDKDIFDRAIQYKTQGVRKEGDYWHDVVGYNYRMTNLCAAIGLAQLERINEICEKKRLLASWYHKGLDAQKVVVQIEAKDVTHSYWLVSILVNDTTKVEKLRNYLADNEIETRPIFRPIHLMPMYLGKEGDHPVAERLSVQGISLPSWPGLNFEQVSHICNLTNKFL